MRPTIRSPGWVVAPLAAVLVAACGANCDDDSLLPCNAADTPLPTSASVGVGTATALVGGATAVDLDADGYQVTFGDSARVMQPTDSWTVRGLVTGVYVVRVADIQENCRVVAPGNPWSFAVDVTVDNGNLEFDLECDPRVGVLTVQTTFTGTSPDPDGYSVVVDGLAMGVVPSNGGVNFPGVRVGLRTVELRGVAANCVVQGQNPRTADIAYAQQNFVAFQVDCPAPGVCSVGAPRAHWTLDGGSAQDVTGNGFSGTVVGATPVLDRNGFVDLALTFDGAASIELGDVLNSVSPPYSVTGWIRQPASARGEFRSILTTDDATGRYFGTWLQVAPSGQLEITYGDGGDPGAGARRTALSDAPLPTDRWVHVAALVRAPDDMVIVVDGVVVPVTLSGSGGPLLHSTAPARIGAASTLASNMPWVGDLDEVRLYTCALDPADVAGLAGS